MISTLSPEEIETLLGPPTGPWGIRRFKNPPGLRPRHKNDIAKFIECEYLPISPATHLVEKEYVSAKHGGFALQPDQIRVLNHAFTPVNHRLPYDTVIYSDIKKSGKTALEAAVMVAWARVYGGEIYGLANSATQAGDRAYSRAVNYLSHLERHDGAKYEEWISRQDVEWVEFKDPYASMRFLPVSPGSAAGAFQSLTAWDEIWNFDREAALRLYSEMQPIPTIPDRVLPEWSVTPGYVVKAPGLRFIATYVGYYGEAELLWELYSQTVNEDPDTGLPRGNRVKGLEDLPCFVSEDGRTFAYWNQDVPRMPWQTPAFIAKAKNDPINKLRPEEFKRLWMNRWTTGSESFMDMAQLDRLMQLGTEAGLVNLHP